MKRENKPRPPSSWATNEWFMCAPTPWRESYIGLDAEQFRVGVTLLWLIYEQDGPLNAPERYLAGLCNLTLHKFRKARDSLIALGKLTLDDQGRIFHPKAEEVIGIRRQYRTDRRKGAETANKLRDNNETAENKLAENLLPENQNANENSKTADAERTLSDDKEKEKKKEDLSVELRSTAAAPPEDPVREEPPFDAKKFVFDTFVRKLGEAGRSEADARSLAAKLWNKHGAADAENVATEMLTVALADVSTWLGGVLKRGPKVSTKVGAIDGTARTKRIVLGADGVPQVEDLLTGVIKPLGVAA